MVSFGGRYSSNYGFGRYTNLKPIITTTKRKAPKETRIMKISEPVYELLRNHSRKYHDQVMSYDDIIEELCSFWNEHHEQKWFLTL